MREGNLLIKASAGTGKTFSLATRYMRLMLLDGVEPEKILALTFSRAAAQEIYTKILERLWKAAASEENASKESKEICKGLGIDRSWKAEKFVFMLRRLLDTQHLGTIATLDSFILRMVRNFPLEMGFQHAVEVLAPADESEAVQDALREILNGTKDAAAFIKVFSAAREGTLPRVLEYKIVEMVKSWRGFVEQHPDCRNWTVASMAVALGIPEKIECPDLSGLPFNKIKRKNAVSCEEQFVKHCQSYDGNTAVFPKNDNVKGLMLKFIREPEAESYDYVFNKVHYTFACGKDGAEKIRAALRYLFNRWALRQLEKAKANLDFMGFVEDAYNRISRRKGKLTFSDFTDISAAKGGSSRAFALENLEYRFDEKFDHWALDEFQDTSELQWACLRNLVESASGGNGRTVMTVGDLKQSIYTWRGGNDAPFKEMMKWPTFTDADFGRIVNSCTSYRYEKNICDFINAVFGPENLRSGGILPPESAAAIESWLDPQCWMTHQPVVKDDGQPKAGDYVKVLSVPDPEGKAKLEALLPALTDELRRIWKAHEACGSTESVGILVRRNEDGTAIAEHLRARAEGIPVVWEGLSAVSDVPVVNALVDLLRLSEHPEDTFAWGTVGKLFPICSTLFGSRKEGELNAKYVSGQVATSLSHRGLSRTLQAYSQALSEDSVGLDPLSKMRLREMVGLAVAYEQRNAGRCSLDGFERFLAASSKRELGASSHVVRILTIHRSKGLTLDRVIVPLPEGVTEGIANPGNRGLVFADGGKWVLPHVPTDAALLNPETARAMKMRADEKLLSSIRMYYVALTRARKAMYVIEPKVPECGGERFFRDVINSAFENKFERRKLDDGREIVFEQGAEPAFEDERKPDATEHDDRDRACAWRHDEPAVSIERVSPSSAGHSAPAFLVRSASGLFSEDAGGAAKKGVEIHGQYEAIEWVEPAAPKDERERAIIESDWQEAFIQKDGMTCWRERSYELFSGNTWETGQFDRVVFSGSGDARQAVIYDFKTNAKREGESVVAFENRLRKTYEGQMAMYVASLAKLTGIPQNRIEAKLLASATMSVIPVRTSTED